jgi:hypothetical protein
MGVTIREKDSGTVLAEAEVGPGLATYEGNWYLDPSGDFSITTGTQRLLAWWRAFIVCSREGR